MSPWHLRLATRHLFAGGVIAYPTEAVFGLGCLPGAVVAAARILALKGRSWTRGMIVVAASLSQAESLVDCTGLDLGPVKASWPGPVTWILPAAPGAPPWLTGETGGVALRISAHPVVRQLCLAAGPLVSTSANPTGRPPARNSLKARAYFGARLDYLVPGETGKARRPSEIRDARSGAVVRKGG